MVRIDFNIKLIYIAKYPSYPNDESYIDIILADYRLTFCDSINNKLENLPYDSDHNAIIGECSIENNNDIDLEDQDNRPSL